MLASRSIVVDSFEQEKTTIACLHRSYQPQQAENVILYHSKFAL